MINFITLLTLSNALATFAVITTLITLFLKQDKAKKISLALFAIVIFSSTIFKNNQDNNAAISSKNTIEIISHKLDTINNYVVKLNSLGIVRDSVNNKPDFTKYLLNIKINNSARQEGNNNIQNNKFDN